MTPHMTNNWNWVDFIQPRAGPELGKGTKPFLCEPLTVKISPETHRRWSIWEKHKRKRYTIPLIQQTIPGPIFIKLLKVPFRFLSEENFWNLLLFLSQLCKTAGEVSQVPGTTVSANPSWEEQCVWIVKAHLCSTLSTNTDRGFCLYSAFISSIFLHVLRKLADMDGTEQYHDKSQGRCSR